MLNTDKLILHLADTGILSLLFIHIIANEVVRQVCQPEQLHRISGSLNHTEDELGDLLGFTISTVGT